MVHSPYLLEAPFDPVHRAKYICSSCGTIDIEWMGSL